MNVSASSTFVKGTVEYLIEKIKKATADAPRLYVPISGGSDSALTFWLLNQACPNKTIGLNCRTSYDTTSGILGRKWIENTGRLITIYLPYCGYKEIEQFRWSKLLSFSLGHDLDLESKPGWLVGCRNRTEHVLGTYSLASRVATFLPIITLWKSQVLQIGQEIGIPAEVLLSSRKADPDCGRPQELANISIEAIDEFCKFCVDNTKLNIDPKIVNREQLDYLLGIKERNDFKRKLPVEVL